MTSTTIKEALQYLMNIVNKPSEVSDNTVMKSAPIIASIPTPESLQVSPKECLLACQVYLTNIPTTLGESLYAILNKMVIC